MKRKINNSHKVLTGLGGFLSLLIMTSGIFYVHCAVAESVIDQINITVPTSCSLSGTGMSSHNATISNGTYQSDIGTTTLKVFCNDTSGFAIYAAGYTNNTIGETDSNKLVGTTSGLESIVTGLATTAGNPDVSNWAMKLTATGDSGDTSGTNALTIDSAPNTAGGADASFNNYHTVPNEFTKVAHKSAATSMDETTGGATLTTTYAAYISKTQAAGSYQGQVIYALVHPASSDAPVVCNSNATTISEVKCLQDFAHVTSTNLNSIINSMTPETQYTLKDSRDGKEYTIAKYQTKYYDASTESEQTAYDVWMTQNLDLDLDASKTYTNEDTDIGYNTNTGTYTTAAWSPERSTYATDITSWGDEGVYPESYDPGDLYSDVMFLDAVYYLDSCRNGSCSESIYAQLSSDWQAFIDTCVSSSCNMSIFPGSDPDLPFSSTGITQHHLGNYYNWSAAAAINDGSLYTVETPIEQSICPAGWTLPRIGVGEDTFYSLWNQYGFSESSASELGGRLWMSPLYFTVGGVWEGIFDNVMEGYFWSSVTGDVWSGGGHFLAYGNVWHSDDYTSSLGNSVRCIARPVVSSTIIDWGGV